MVAQDRNTEDEEALSRRVKVLVIAGILTVAAGIAILAITTVLYGEGQASFGTIIFIGPVPIVFGAGPGALWLILIAAILAALIVVMFTLMVRGKSKNAASET